MGTPNFSVEIALPQTDFAVFANGPSPGRTVISRMEILIYTAYASRSAMTSPFASLVT